jgi:hypothetical protein
LPTFAGFAACRSILKQYLDGISLNDDVMNNPINPLLVVNNRLQVLTCMSVVCCAAFTWMVMDGHTPSDQAQFALQLKFACCKP